MYPKNIIVIVFTKNKLRNIITNYLGVLSQALSRKVDIFFHKMKLETKSIPKVNLYQARQRKLLTKKQNPVKQMKGGRR
jgi:hypothetical protein